MEASNHISHVKRRTAITPGLSKVKQNGNMYYIIYHLCLHAVFLCTVCMRVSGTWQSILANMNDQSESSIPESRCHNPKSPHRTRPYIPHNLPPVHTHLIITPVIFLVYNCFTLQSIQ